MKRYFVILISFVFFATMSVAENKEDNLVIEFLTIQQCIIKNEIGMARQMLDKIKIKATNSDNWHDKYEYYRTLGDIYAFYDNKTEEAIDNFINALKAYPPNAFLDQEYLGTTYDLCCLFEQMQQCYIGEKYAAHALVRAQAVVDSCFFSSGLFSYLAKSYENRGDTIMPLRFHLKAQELSIRYNILTSEPDSVEIYNERLNNMLRLLHYSRKDFSDTDPSYLRILSDYYVWVSRAGNLPEAIWLGEYIMKNAQKYSIDEDICLYNTYYYLLYNYAVYGKINELQNLYHHAVKYYSLYPDKTITESILCLGIANGFMESSRFKEALEYLKIAKLKNNKKLYPQIEMKINHFINECKEEL